MHITSGTRASVEWRRSAWARLAIAAAATALAALATTGCTAGGGTTTPTPAAARTTSASPSDPTESIPLGDPANDPQVGDCWTFRPDDPAYEPTDCAAPHTHETFYVESHTGESDGPDPFLRLRDFDRQTCNDLATDYLGSADWMLSLISWQSLPPTPDDIDAGANWIRCDLIVPEAAHPVVAESISGSLNDVLSTEAGFDAYRACFADENMDPPVPCTEPHLFEVLRPILDLTQYFDSEPTSDEFNSVLAGVCDPIVADFVGASRDDVWTSGWTIDRLAWARGVWKGFCMAATDIPVVGSVGGIGDGELPVAG